MFIILGFFVDKILSIVWSHIETKIIISIVGILINLKRCGLHTKDF